MIPELISFPGLASFLERFFSGWELQRYSNAGCLASWPSSSDWDRTVLSSPPATPTTTTTATMAVLWLEPAGLGKRKGSRSWQWPHQFDGGLCWFAPKSSQNGVVSFGGKTLDYECVLCIYISCKKVSIILFRETKLVYDSEFHFRRHYCGSDSNSFLHVRCSLAPLLAIKLINYNYYGTFLGPGLLV